MREIKYRAWDKNYKHMAGRRDIDPYIHWIEPEGMVFEVLANHFIFLQYTGIKDKNGNEICEGDICKSPESIFVGSLLEIIFVNACLVGVVRNSISKDKDPFYAPIQSNWEVVGNIYENPELLII